MPGFLYHVGASAICPHGGQVATVSTNTRVLVNGQPAGALSDTSLVTGCVFMVGTKPQPCIKVQWLVPAARILINGQPALLQTSTGICQSVEQLPQGPPTILAVQPRVSGM